MLSQARVISIIGLLVTLITLGTITLLHLISSSIGREIQERMSFSVELGNDLSASPEELLEELSLVKGIKSVDYLDADSAARLVQSEIGEDPIKVLGYNPFSPILRLKLEHDYLSQDSLLVIEQRLRERGVDTHLSYQKDILHSMQDNIGRIQSFLWAVLVLQLLLSILQINSSTKLLIHSERMTIRTLALVGASSWFIRRPILLRALGDGLISVLLALSLLGLGLYATQRSLNIDVWSMLRMSELLIAVALLITVALFVCALSSWRASHRYIRMDGSKIHLV